MLEKHEDIIHLTTVNQELSASLNEAKGKIQELQQILIEYQMENKEMRKKTASFENEMKEMKQSKDNESTDHPPSIPLEPVIIVNNAPNEKPKRVRPKTAKQQTNESDQRTQKVIDKFISSSDDDTYVV